MITIIKKNKTIICLLVMCLNISSAPEMGIRALLPEAKDYTAETMSQFRSECHSMISPIVIDLFRSYPDKDKLKLAQTYREEVLLYLTLLAMNIPETGKAFINHRNLNPVEYKELLSSTLIKRIRNSKHNLKIIKLIWDLKPTLDKILRTYEHDPIIDTLIPALDLKHILNLPKIPLLEEFLDDHLSKERLKANQQMASQREPVSGSSASAKRRAKTRKAKQEAALLQPVEDANIKYISQSAWGKFMAIFKPGFNGILQIMRKLEWELNYYLWIHTIYGVRVFEQRGKTKFDIHKYIESILTQHRTCLADCLIDLQFEYKKQFDSINALFKQEPSESNMPAFEKAILDLVETYLLGANFIDPFFSETRLVDDGVIFDYYIEGDTVDSGRSFVLDPKKSATLVFKVVSDYQRPGAISHFTVSSVGFQNSLQAKFKIRLVLEQLVFRNMHVLQKTDSEFISIMHDFLHGTTKNPYEALDSVTSKFHKTPLQCTGKHFFEAMYVLAEWDFEDLEECAQSLIHIKIQERSK